MIEERLDGPEVSLLALCAGEVAVPLPPAQDFKRIGDGDAGPNTGGMGAYSPVPGLDDVAVRELVDSVHVPVLRELDRRGIHFRGCLYAGLMLTADGPKVLEFNVRFGDPEAQAVLPRLDADLLERLAEAAAGSLQPRALDAAAPRRRHASCWRRAATPRRARPACRSTASRRRRPTGALVFHAGTALRDGRLATAGGRVLAVSALGDSLAAARERAYAGVERIRFDGAQRRSDIALAAAGREATRA